MRATDRSVGGTNIGIEIASTVSSNLMGGYWDLDNVRLTETVAPALNSPGMTNGQFSLTLLSEPELQFELLAGTNITQSVSNWTGLGVITNLTGTAVFNDPATGLARRFYRAHQL